MISQKGGLVAIYREHGVHFSLSLSANSEMSSVAFKLPYVYDYITQLCRQQAEVIQNHDNENVCNIGQCEARHRKYKRLKLGGGQAYDRSSV
jgi:hypothetical protein